MKTQFLFLTLIILIGCGQPKKPNEQENTINQNGVSPNYKSGKEYLENGKDYISYPFDKHIWYLYVVGKKQEHAPTKAEDVPADIEKYLLSNSSGFGYDLIKKYKVNIDTTFQRLKLLGTDQLGNFFYDHDQRASYPHPVHFLNYGVDMAISLIISGVFIDKVYNTLKLTSRQRATKVVTTYLLPALKHCAENFNGSEIKYFGITAVYGSKDALNESALATEAEYVALIVPASLIKKFASGEITEDELLKAADIYVSDRDMITGVKKIKITLE